MVGFKVKTDEHVQTYHDRGKDRVGGVLDRLAMNTAGDTYHEKQESRHDEAKGGWRAPT